VRGVCHSLFLAAGAHSPTSEELDDDDELEEHELDVLSSKSSESHPALPR